jgi:hypothetical protein
MKHEYDPQRINDLAAELLSPQSFSGGGVARLKRKLGDTFLPGAPESANIPNVGEVQLGQNLEADKAAERAAEMTGVPYKRVNRYAPVDVARARQIAREYDLMKHDPDDPLVKMAYDQMIRETTAQYQAMLDAGIEPYFFRGDQDPYRNSPYEALLDIAENRRLGVFPTTEGFGTSADFDASRSPMLAPTGFQISGQPALANDLFRAVHDYFGHAKSGVGFRAAGEENAFQAHAGMFSPLARRALATETRGQNSWLNYGPYGESNRTASLADTRFADQKTGLMPRWVSEAGTVINDDRRQAFFRALEADPGRFQGAITDDGKLRLVHYSDRELERIDPEQYGRNLSGRSRAERNRASDPNFLKRSFYGIPALQEPYRRELGIGPVRNEVLIEPELLYDARLDPDNLKAGDVTKYEKNIADAGYTGYYTNDEKLGKVAVVFDPYDVSKTYMIPIAAGAGALTAMGGDEEAQEFSGGGIARAAAAARKNRPVKIELGINRAKEAVEKAGYNFADIHQVLDKDDLRNMTRRYGLPSAISERDDPSDVFHVAGSLFWDEDTGKPVAYATSEAMRRAADDLESFADGGRVRQNPLSWLNQKFYENVSKPAVGTAIDMTLGLGDLAQMAARYLGDRAGFDTGEFVSVADPVKRALGVDDYDPYTLGAAATNILPFARGRELAGAGVNALQRTFPNIGRETAAYGGAELAAAGAREFAPDSPMAEMAAAVVGGMGGSALGSSPDALGIIKPKGGNWLGGSIEDEIERLHIANQYGGVGAPADRLAAMEARYTPEVMASLSPDLREHAQTVLDTLRSQAQIDNWIDSKLSKYIRNEMATESDPIRLQADAFEGVRAERLAQKDAQIARAVENMERARLERGRTPEEMTASREQIRELQRERALIEAQTGLHVDPDEMGHNRYRAPRVRLQAGYPEDDVSQTHAGRAWERSSDVSFDVNKAGELLSERGSEYLTPEGLKRMHDDFVDKNPWLLKVPPATPVYSMRGNNPLGSLGFDHMMDELRNATRPGSDLPENLRIDPNYLSKMSVPQMVRRVDEINAWRALQRTEADALKAFNAATIPHRDYETIPYTNEPNVQGLRWVQIASPDRTEAVAETVRKEYPGLEQNDPRQFNAIVQDELYSSRNTDTALQDALKYEGDAMGHCVGGYCDEVREGATRIFSLRDANGRPHATVEVQDVVQGISGEILNEMEPGIWNQIVAERGHYDAYEWLRQNRPDLLAKLEARPTEKIKQIKGVRNAAPSIEYEPFVQDFVKSGRWSEVGDIQNTGLYTRDRMLVKSPRSLQSLSTKEIDRVWDSIEGDYVTETELLDKARELFPDRFPSEQKKFAKGGKVESLSDMARRYMGNASEAKNLLKASLFNMYSPFEARDIVEDPNDWRLSDATMRMPGIVDLAVGMPNLPSDLLAIYGMLADNESAIERSERLQVPFAARAQERYMSGLEDAVMRSTGKEIDELSLPMKGILGASEVLSQPGIIPAKALSKLPSIGRGISNALEVFTPVSVASPAALGVGSALGAGLMVLPDLIDSDLEQMDQKYSTAVAEKKRTEGRKQPEKMAAGGLVYDADRVNALAAELTGSEKFSGGGTARLARAARESAKAREQGSEAVSSLANDSGRAADDRFPERIMSVSDAMGVDPRIFQGGSGRQLSGPRLSDIDRLQSLVVETGDRRLPEIPEFRIEDYEGYPIISSMSDRAAAGDFITKINDIPVMVNRRGGQDYMFDPLNEGRVWASDASVVTGQGQTRMQNMAESLRRQYGRDPLLAPWTMAPTGVDYSTMTGETMLQFARNNMTAKTIRQVDKDIKSIIPDWKGIKSEDSIFDFYQASGDQRKSIIQLMDKKYRDAGSLTSGEARLAVTDPGQYMSRDGVLRNIGMIDAAAGATPESAHPTYNMALRGRGLGRLSMPIQAYELFPEAATLGGFDPLNPPRNALRALEMKPYSTLITDDLIRSIQDRRLGN